jgi:transposase
MAKIRPKERSVEEKTAIVLALVRGEATAAELCRRHGMSENTLYKWRDRFLAAGQQALANGRARQSATSALKQENQALKEALADAVLRNELLKKTRLL